MTQPYHVFDSRDGGDVLLWLVLLCALLLAVSAAL
jgi:hypothetical protein